VSSKVVQAITRRLAAILVADMVGFTRSMSADEVGTYHRFRADLDGHFTPAIDRFGGRIVKTTGDGLIAEFASAVDAVRCADEMQRALGGRAEPPCYRMGINVGDIIADDGDVFGDDVNIAVRLEQLAEPGGIAVSRAAYRSVRNKLDLGFVGLGRCALKNVPEPIEVYRVVAEGAAPASPAVAGRGRPLVIVLPFDRLGASGPSDGFAEGLVNDVITDLSKFSLLRVVDSHTAFAYREPAVPSRSIHDTLGVAYLVEGSVQHAGGEARINVQLIDAVAGHHIWADRLVWPASRIEADQDAISRRIVVAVAARLAAIERLKAAAPPVGDLDAYGLYQRGVELYSNETEARLKASRAMFERALEADPQFARAWGYLAYTLVQGWIGGWDGEEALERAKALAVKAVALDPGDCHPHWILGFVRLHLRLFAKALEAYRRAIALNRCDGNLLAEYAEALFYSGNHRRGIAQVREAIRLNPHGPEWYRWDLAWGHYLMGAYGRAFAELEALLDPHNDVRLLRAATAARLGRGAMAAAEMRRFRACRPDWTVAAERRSVPFRYDHDAENWIAGVRLAGLPE